MKTFKELLQPKTIADTLIRLGVNGDGGYIINKKTIESIKKCYSYGIGDEMSFEQDLSKHNPDIILHLYDHTINCPNLFGKAIFHKEGLSAAPKNQMNNFFNHLKINDDYENQSEILLKVDAERAEYDLFNNFPASDFSKLPAMIIEFHDADIRYVEFCSIINKLIEYFDIIHIHGNNSTPRFSRDGLEISNHPEITFLNKNLNPNSKNLYIKYPIEGLDFANVGASDSIIDFT